MPNWASLVRLLRRRLVLGIIFTLSLTYCAISLLSNEKFPSSLMRIRNQGEDNDDGNLPLAEYSDNGDDDASRDSGKNIDWQLELDNNYEVANEDSADNALTKHDSNDTSIVTRTCRNSIQGKALIVDEHGYVCARFELLPTGCCPRMLPEKAEEETNVESPPSLKRKRYSCETCNPQGCCAIYEYCVSCCLQPGKRRGKKGETTKNIGDRERRENLKARRGEDAVKLRLRSLDRFQMCLAACRTSSASVRHENTYKDPDSKYCYSQYQRYRRDDSLLKNNNVDNSKVVVTSSSTFAIINPAPNPVSNINR